MTKELLAEKPDLEPLATGLAETFFQRRDLYARQLEDGSYICIRKPLEVSHLVAHLAGKLTLGTYVLDPSSQASYIVFDADDGPQFERAVHLSNNLAKECVPSYLEESRRGGHLWLFFSNPMPGKDARLFARQVAEKHHLNGVEIFPKQDKLTSGPGSLIRLPFGVHRKTGLRYGFITPDHQPLSRSLPDQYRILSAPETVPEAFIKSKMAGSSSLVRKPVLEGVEQLTMPLSEKIKASIGAYDFISQYVELSPSGRGLCPFHTDERTSFSVNIEKNYWHCFAGCGGGSIIDFWMKRQGCGFSQAVHELAELLLLPALKAKEPGD
jgi:hypothetical protein